MTSSLSQESLIKAYDHGILSADGPNFELAQETVSSLAENPERARLLPAQVVYFAIKAAGLSESHEVLKLITTDQWTRILDYDVWTGDVVSQKKIFQWLMELKEVSSELLFERFRELEEEYQVETLCGLITAYSKDEMEELSDAVQDQLVALPGEEIFYAINTDDNEIRNAAMSLMETLISSDMAFALSALSYATWSIKNENVALLKQFRDARLEEDGFVTAEERNRLYQALDVKAFESKWKLDVTAALKSTSKEVFLDRALAVHAEDHVLHESLKITFLHLCNTLASASDHTPDDLESMKKILAHIKGYLSIALERLAGDSTEHAAHILKSVHPVQLYRYTHTLILQSKATFLNSLESADAKLAAKLIGFLHTHRFGRMLDALDRHFLAEWGLQKCEIIKGIFNRFPMIPTSTEQDRIRFKMVASVYDLEQLKSILDREGHSHEHS